MAVLDWLQSALGGGGDPDQQRWEETQAQQPAVLQHLLNVLADTTGRFSGTNSYDPNKSLAQNVLDPESLQQAVTVGMQVGPAAIRAYHGSPHDFTKFDPAKIGTGEGAQAYGHGLYFAENEGVARSYRDNLTLGSDPRAFINEIINYLHNPRVQAAMPQPAGALFNRNDIISQLQRYGQTREIASNERLVDHIVNATNGYDIKSDTYSPAGMRSLQYLDKELPPPSRGHMYEVDLHADPEAFLNWDRPLSNQSPQIRQTLQDMGLINPRSEHLSVLQRAAASTGQDIYHQIIDRLSPTGLSRLNAPPQASAALVEQGIPGIRYLDQGSRGAGEGTSNYVVFNPKIIEIMRKYGLVGPLAAGGGAAALGTSEPDT